MRIFIASFCHESSCFSPIPTSRRSFEEFDYYRPVEGKVDETALALNGYGAFIRKALADGHTPFLSTYTFAQPSAPLSKSVYEEMREEILDDLRDYQQTEGGVDIVLYFLHGAQTAQGYDDCEGDILTRSRDIVGPDCFIGALLDLHTNMSEQMIEAATALVACRYYPHTDFNERGEHLYDIAIEAATGKVNPVSHYKYVPMLAMHYTTAPVMEQINARALDLQNKEGVLSVSMIHGFQWADIPHVGAGVLVIADGDTDVEADMQTLAQDFFDNREESRSLRKPIGNILDYIESKAGDIAKPIIVADACDNPGGGAGSDSTFILAEILKRGLTGYGFAILWDPLAVSLAADAGEGAELNMRLGGKTGPFAGDPVDAKVKVLRVVENAEQHGLGYVHPMGRSVALEVSGNMVIVSSIRGQVFNPSCFRDLGVEPESLKALVVKSSQHFHATFAPLAEEVLYCDTPGSMSLYNLSEDSYQRIPRPIWPLDNIEKI